MSEIQKICQRCSSVFDCRQSDIIHCACSGIHLHESTQQYLNQTKYNDCLCINCLKQLDELVQQSLELKFPVERKDLKEGLHYYYDNGYFVFTEMYHLLRGSCCGNVCRHCAWGNKHK